MLRLFRHIRQRLFLRRPEGYEGHVFERRVSRYFGYAVGEVVLIVVGILIALEANEWKEERRDRIEERAVLGRISQELKLNSERLNGAVESLENRMERLERVIAAFDGKPVENNKAFLDDVILASTLGTRNRFRSAFEELRSSGKFGLIRRVSLRDSIIEFYDRVEQWEERDTRMPSNYATRAMQLVPRTKGYMVKEGLNDEQYAKLTNAVLNSNLHEFIVEAQNRNDLTLIMMDSLNKRSETLLAKIEAYLAD